MVTQSQSPIHDLDAPTHDVGPLVWILREVDHSLESARQSLRKFTLEQAERARSGGIADTSTLRTARSQLHQATGAVEVVGLAGAPSFLKALEAAVAHCVEQPEALTPQSLEELERAMNALHEYLQSASSGRKPQPLKLFTSYAPVLKIGGSERIHPADLWDYDFEWRDAAPNRASNSTPEMEDASVSKFDRAILLLLRGKGPEAAAQLSPAIDATHSKASTHSAKAFWAIAAAVVEAVSKHAIKIDDHLKRAFTRMSLQVRSQVNAQGDLSERLGRDLLFFVSQAAPIAAERSIWLGPVLTAYDLTHQERVDYSERHYAAVDPAVLQLAQRRVSGLKQLWAELSNGDISRIRAVAESSDLVAESLTQLGADTAGSLGNHLSKLVKRCILRAEEMTADRALEVANAILFLEAALQSGEINGTQFAERQKVLSDRLQKSFNGQAAGAMDPWMEELYRKSSEAATMGSVVSELKNSMASVESALDRYFRNANDREALAQVPGLLSQARGVLSVLGLDHAAAAVGHARSVTENWVLADGPASTDESQLLAQNLGALSFMVDLLGYQPAAAKSMFVFDAATHEFKSDLREPIKSKKTEKRAPHSDQLHAALDHVAQQLSLPSAALATHGTNIIETKLEALKLEATIADTPHIRDTATTALNALRAGDTDHAAQLLSEHVAVAAKPSYVDPSLANQSATHKNAPSVESDDGDDELLEIFLDEAKEVSDAGELQIGSLRQSPSDHDALITLRRSFHTLKGSSRMVGLTAFGDSAWQMEQVLNGFLAEPKAATPALLDLSADALTQFKHWIELIKTHKSSHTSLVPDTWPASFIASAEAFKASGVYFPLVLDEALSSANDMSIADSDSDTIDVGLQDYEGLDIFVDKAPAVSLAHNIASANEAAVDAISLDLSSPFQDNLAEAPHTAPSIQADEVSLDEFFAAAGISTLHDSNIVDIQTNDTSPSSTTQPVHDITADIVSSSAQVLIHPSALPLAPAAEDEYKQVGELRIPIGLHSVYLSEADELVRKLTAELDMWRIEAPASADYPVVPEGAISAAHTLAGTSATVGVNAIADLGYDLEASLLACQAQQHAPTSLDHAILNSTADEMRKLLHQFAAGFIKDADNDIQHNIASLKDAWKLPRVKVAIEPQPAASVINEPKLTPAESVIAIAQTPTAEPDVPIHLELPVVVVPTLPVPTPADVQFVPPLPTPTVAITPSIQLQIPADDSDLSDSIDPDLFPIFEEEASELLPSLAQALRSWQSSPQESEQPKQSLRVLHTFKGSARLAGAMRLGEMAHQLETDVESVLRDTPSSSAITQLVEQCDELVARFEQVRSGEVHSPHEFEYHADTATTPHNIANIAQVHVADTKDSTALISHEAAGFKLTAIAAAVPTQLRTQQAVRVKAGLLDRLFNQAGEVSITRSRLENEIGSIKGSLGDLTDNLSRLREQLRAIELQAETQMQSRMAATKEASDFDPLEFDRFTRFQELTRMMAESVNDVATVQQTLNRTLITTEDDLQRQARMTRELQRDLLRTRMVEFESLSERLYRVVRQTAKELGKNVRLDIIGGQIEIDRGVLERMAGSFEHLLRNCVAHGIEVPQTRTKLGKADAGQINIALKQEGNEVSIIFSDDGSGLDFTRIREKARKLKLLDESGLANESALAELIFAPGFSTADTVSEISGRGIGMDVVKNEILGLGGRVTVATQLGQGTTFTLVLPLTTAVTQIVLLRTGTMTVGVPSSLIEIVQRLKGSELAERYSLRTHNYAGLNVDFYPLGHLLQASSAEAPRSAAEGRTNPIVVIRSAAQRVAVHVDEILGNQEVVVRNLGPQLSRVPGLAGMSVLASGAIVLIYNPVALASVYGPSLRAQTLQAEAALAALAKSGASAATPTDAAHDAERQGREPTVMVVDDSLTVRRVTQRLLQRNGYKVVLAKDGLDALEILQSVNPDIMLLDIEMPRMDGFDLTRNMRSITSTDKLRQLPIVMITSRIADKHKTLAMELGVNHYLGKPYNEEELLSLIGKYTGVAKAAVEVTV